MLLNIINTRWFAPLSFMLLWAVLFFGNDEMIIVYHIFDSLFTAACVISAFYLGRYYFPKLENNKKIKYKIILWSVFILLMCSAARIFDLYLDEELLKDDRFNWLSVSFDVIKSRYLERL